jgi:hypothetical protein
VSAQTSPNTLHNFRLRINAAAGEAVHGRGAVWMDGSNTNVVIVDQQTPIEMETYGSVVNGTLKVDGHDRIRVQVTDETNGTPTLAVRSEALQCQDSTAVPSRRGRDRLRRDLFWL